MTGSIIQPTVRRQTQLASSGHSFGSRVLRCNLTFGSPNKSLQRSSGRCTLVCTSLAVIDKVPTTRLGEPPGAELRR